MGELIRVRPAVPGDKGNVLRFCQNTFSWGDYIEVVWDDWIADPDGQIFVGLDDDTPVAIVHAAILVGGVAWLEGMRVHPDYRRRGVSTAIDAAARDYGRGHGCHVARLATSMKNIAAQAALGPQGYALVAPTASWIATPLDDVPAAPRIAVSTDLPSILGRWNQSSAREACGGLVPDSRWRWTQLKSERLSEQIRSDQVRVASTGFSIVFSSTNDHEKEFTIEAIVGDRETTSALALDARREAGTRGFPRLEALVADDPIVEAGLSAAGFAREGGMLVYEQAL